MIIATSKQSQIANMDIFQHMTNKFLDSKSLFWMDGVTPPSLITQKNSISQLPTS